jgi:Pyridoxamine 5'-phosphate oxidase
MTATDTIEPAIGGLQLPEWPVRTIAVLATLGEDGPHAIPVSAPVRANDHRILLNLHRTRDSLQRLRERPYVAVTVLAAENVAFTARGRARVVQAPMTTSADYVAVGIDVDRVDDHRQPGFEVAAGVDRRWVDEAERDALGRRVRALTALAS